MSKQLNIHLFNCDRTYKLDVVEKWLNASQVKSKLGIDVKVKQHIFPLSKMTEWSSEAIPGLKMDVAVFVVHAHESRLSINEENAGIGYAKVYRALRKRTGGKVLIVIGGDDSYKDENEEDTAFISRWAKRKISSQFSEDLIDGRKSFIFSWNQEHREIHEEALVHFLDHRKRGEKFEYQLKGKSPQVSEMAISPKANESTWRKDPRERKSKQGQIRSDAVGEKPVGMKTYPGASRGKRMTENRTPHTGKDGSWQDGGTDPLQSDSFWKASLRESTSLHTQKEGSSRIDEGDCSVGYHPPQKDTSRKASSPSGYTPPHSGKEGTFHGMGESDHSVGNDPFQSNISQNASSLIGSTPLHSGKEGTFHGMGESDHSVGNDPFQSNISQNASSLIGNTPLHSGNEGSFGRMGESDYSLRSDPLQSGALCNPSSGAYPSLYSDKLGSFEDLAAAESNETLQKDLSILGWDASEDAMTAVVDLINRHRDVLNLSTDTDCLNGSGDVNDVISYFEHNPLKYCVLVVDADKIKAMIEQEKVVDSRLLQTADRKVENGIIITLSCPWFQSEEDKSRCEKAIKKAVNDNRKVFILWFENGNLVVNPDEFINFLTSCQFSQQPSVAAYCPQRRITGKQNWNYKIYLPSGKTVLVLTRIRRGIISNQIHRPEDVQYWKPGFVVPREIEDDLLKKNAKTSNGELFILMSKEGKLSCLVDKMSRKEWENSMKLYLDEIIVLQTKLKHGKISFDKKDLVIHHEKWEVPPIEVERLQQKYKETPTADLFIASDPKGNSRCVVKIGTSSQVYTFINEVFNEAFGKKVNLI